MNKKEYYINKIKEFEFEIMQLDSDSEIQRNDINLKMKDIKNNFELKRCLNQIIKEYEEKIERIKEDEKKIKNIMEENDRERSKK